MQMSVLKKYVSIAGTFCCPTTFSGGCVVTLRGCVVTLRRRVITPAKTPQKIPTQTELTEVCVSTWGTNVKKMAFSRGRVVTLRGRVITLSE